MSQTTKKFDVTPVGMQTEEGCKRITEALEKRNTADFECYKALRDLIENLGDHKKLVDMILAYCDFSRSTPEDVQFAEQIVDVAKAALKNRDAANQDFILAAAGRPTTQE
jgi:hypothetical protein